MPCNSNDWCKILGVGCSILNKQKSVCTFLYNICFFLVLLTMFSGEPRRDRFISNGLLDLGHIYILFFKLDIDWFMSFCLQTQIKISLLDVTSCPCCFLQTLKVKFKCYYNSPMWAVGRTELTFYFTSMLLAATKSFRLQVSIT